MLPNNIQLYIYPQLVNIYVFQFILLYSPCGLVDWLVIGLARFLDYYLVSITHGIHDLKKKV